jgi:hypothetical protein
VLATGGNALSESRATVASLQVSLQKIGAAHAPNELVSFYEASRKA